MASTRRHLSAARVTSLFWLQASMSQQHTFPIHMGSATSPDVAAATDASSLARPPDVSRAGHGETLQG